MARLKTPIPKRLPVPKKPDAAERQYLRFLNKYASVYARLMRAGLEEILPKLRETAADELPEVRQDSWRMDAVNIEKKVQAVLEDVEEELKRLFPETMLRRWAQAMVGSVNKTEKRNIKGVAEKLGLEVEPMLHDRDLNLYFQNVVDENVGLIRSIPKEKLTTFKNSLVAAITSDQPASVLQAIIQKNFRVTKARAALIARDQIGKLNGKVNQYRQQQLGGQRYRWRGSKDSRERPDHLRLEGKVFSWDSPPIVDRKSGRRGHPGEDYQCRCRAEMVIEDIVE